MALSEAASIRVASSNWFISKIDFLSQGFHVKKFDDHSKKKRWRASGLSSSSSRLGSVS
jgi:hypothetical protein